MNFNKKRMALAIIFLLTCNFFSNLVLATEIETTNKNKDELLDDTSSEIVIGEVKELHSEWYNTTYFSNVYTFATIEISKIERASNIDKETINVVFEGGSINGRTFSVERSPWGELKFPSSGSVKLNLIPSTLFKNCYYVLSVESLDNQGDGLLSVPGVYIAEILRLQFSWNGYYPDSFTGRDYYYIGSTVPVDIYGDGWLNAIESAFDEWEDVPESLITFSDQGNRNSASLGNGYNEILWDNLGSGIVALCYRYDSPYTPFEEFDIVLNTYYDWSIGAESGKYDVQAILTHEIGHSLGLRNLDYYSSSQTMWYQASTNSVAWRTIELGDEAGSQYLSPSYMRPTVTKTSPSYIIYQYTSYTVAATVSGPSIDNVKYRVVTADDYSYASGWTTMSYNSGTGKYEASWYTGSLDGDYYIIIRAESTLGIYGYDFDIHVVT